MRIFDKIKNIKNANLLAEQRYFENKNIDENLQSSNDDDSKLYEMAGRNFKDVIINIPDEFSLSLIKRTSALSNNFWPKDLERFEVGDNKITVNHFIYGRLKNSYPEFGKPFGVRDAESIDEDMVQEGSDTYFETLSEALDAVRQKVEQLGFEVDEDAMFTQFGTCGIPYETEKSANIPLLMNGEPILDKRGREANRYIRVSIYRMSSGRYELTMYKTW
jgi:hypothetical protein